MSRDDLLHKALEDDDQDNAARLSILRNLLASSDIWEQGVAAHRLFHLGENVSQEELDNLTVSENINDKIGLLLSNLLKLGHLSTHQEQDVKSREERYGIITWLIAHHPQSFAHQSVYVYLDAHKDAAAYARGKELWLNAVRDNPGDVKILENAIRFTAIHDVDVCLELIRKCQQLHPHSPLCETVLKHLRNPDDKEAADQE